MFGFSVDFSPTVEIKSAKAPDTPTDVLTSIDGLYVKIAWTAPSDNYDQITRYEILIQTKAGEWIPNTETCDGADETIKSQTECWVSLASLLSTNY